jgi:DUF971 family protein
MWRWLTGAAGAVSAALLVALRIATGQRNKARDDALREAKRAAESEARRETEQRIRDAQRYVRIQAIEAAQNEDIRKATGDRSRGLDNSRLIDD